MLYTGYPISINYPVIFFAGEIIANKFLFCKKLRIYRGNFNLNSIFFRLNEKSHLFIYRPHKRQSFFCHPGTHSTHMKSHCSRNEFSYLSGCWIPVSSCVRRLFCSLWITNTQFNFFMTCLM